MSTTYDVVLRLSTSGSLTSQVGAVGSVAEKAEKAVSRVGGAFESVGSKVSSVITSITSSVESVAVGLAKWGGAGVLAGIAGITYSVNNLNGQLEQTTISLGAIFNAQGLTGNFAGGMSLAADQVKKMMKDVETLPGTFGQLAQLMQTTATTGIGAGMNANQLRRFAGRTMLIGSIVAPTIDNNLLSKEIVNLMAGKAGTHNILGLRLGLQGEEAKKLNAMAPEERLAKLNEIYDKYKDATDAIAHSWKAVTTTMKGNVLYDILQPVTKPLFDNVKADMIRINDYFTDHEERIGEIISKVSHELAGAWDNASSLVERVGDRVRGIEPGIDNLSSGWIKIANAIGDAVKWVEKLNVSKIEDAAMKAGKMYLAMKIAPTAISLATGAGNIGAIGGEAAGIALGGPAAILAMAAAAGIAAGALHNLADKASPYHEAAVSDAKNISENLKLINRDIGTGGLLGSVGDFLGGGAMGIASGMSDIFAAGADLAAEFAHITHQLSPFGEALRHTVHIGIGYDRENASAAEKLALDRANVSMMSNPMFIRPSNALAEQEGQRDKSDDLNKRNFGTNIQKVEIVVKGSDDPTRVARNVVELLKRVGKHKTTSSENMTPLAYSRG
jgi:hypothetical protein